MKKAGIFYTIAGAALMILNIAVLTALMIGVRVPVISAVFYAEGGSYLDNNNALTLLVLYPLSGALSYVCLSGFIWGLYLLDKAFGFGRPIKIIFTVASAIISLFTVFILLKTGGAFSSEEGGGGFLLWMESVLFLIAMIAPLFFRNHRILIGTLLVAGLFFALGLAIWFFIVNVFFGILMLVAAIILVIGVIKGLYDAFINKSPASDRPNYFLNTSGDSREKKNVVYRYKRSSAAYRTTRVYTDPVFGHEVCDKDVDITFYFENDDGGTITKSAKCKMTGVTAGETFSESDLEYKFGYMLDDIRK